METLLLTTEARINNGKKTVFTKWCWKNWIAMCKIIKLEYFLMPFTMINSKQIKGLNVRPETIKLLKENQSKILYDPPPRVMEIKTTINKWYLIKLKGFCIMKKTISEVKRQPS